MPWDRKAPWSGGQLLDYTPRPFMDGVEWRDADESMRLSLIFQGFYGTSSAIAEFRETDGGKKYPMFTTELTDVIERNAFGPNGTLSGEFRVVKRGRNFGIKLI